MELGNIRPASDFGHRSFQFSKSRYIGIERKFVLGILGLDLVYNSIFHATADPKLMSDG